MATPDFSKIWGSAAEQKYNFSDDDYVRGWQFIGSTPPSRQMFDAWMRSGDEKNKYLYDIMSDALGAATPGGMAIDDTKVPTGDKNNLITLLSNLANVEKGIIGGASWRDNPAITLAAMNAFVQQLAAGSDVEWSGSTWKNKKLGMTGLMAQNGYISFGPNFGGLIIQWGITAQGIFTFPIAFSQVFSVVALKNNDHGGGVPNIITSSNLSVIIELEWLSGGQHTSNPNGVNAIVIGK